MNQHDYDNREEAFTNQYTPEEEKQQALADVIMAKMINDFEDDSTEVLDLLAQHLTKMSLGQIDSCTTDSFCGLLGMALHAPFDKRFDTFNRFVIDALYAEAYEIAELGV